MLREGTRKYVGKTGSRGPVRLRASGLAAGRNAHFAPGVLLPDVKKPSESKEPWKHYPVKAVISAANAAPPPSKSKCRLVQP